MKYAIFIGCQISSRVTQYEMAAREVLNKLGIELVDVRQFNCCGYPMRDTDFKAFLLSSSRNIALAARLNLPMLVMCKCCFGSLKKAQSIMDEEGDLQREIRDIPFRENLEYGKGTAVIHFLSVLHNEVVLEKIKENITRSFKDLNIATHYGCHALRPSSITQFDDPVEPVIFDRLVEITGAKSVKWPMKLECCGSHAMGVNDDLSMELTRRKLEDSRRSGADFLVVACPYCQIQFDSVQEMILSGEDRDERIGSILYPQLLGLSMGIEEKTLGIDMNRIDISGIRSYLSEE